MNSLPLEYMPTARDELAAIRGLLRPAVLEQLTRVAVNYATCSQETKFPRTGGRESGLWCRYPNGRAALVEVVFRIEGEGELEESLAIRRILVSELQRLPPWAIDPTGWGSVTPWPVVEL